MMLSLNARSIGMQAWGSGKKSFLLLHGLSRSKACWRDVAPGLAAHGRVVALDLPGHGESPLADFSCAMRDFAALVREAIAALALEDLVIVGHSMGAQVAMTLLLDTPQVAQRLVLAAPAGIETFTQEEAALMRAAQTPEKIRAQPRSSVAKTIGAFTFSPPPDLEEQIAWRMNEMARSDDLAKTISRCVDGMLAGRLFERLPTLRVPTLVVFGEEDRLIPNRYFHPGVTSATGAAALAAIPEAQLLMLPQTGHMVPEEHPQRLCEAILSFGVQ